MFALMFAAVNEFVFYMFSAWFKVWYE